MGRAHHALGAALLAATLGFGGCDALENEARDQAEESDTGPTTSEEEGEESTAPPVEPARCPEDLAGCRTASGIVVYVERVDPDGDGDAHFILDSEESVTADGISAIDVRQDLRPDPLPGPGDRVSAAGPVFPGSFGQRQIEAVVVHASYTASE